jgi:hypothetical protein
MEREGGREIENGEEEEERNYLIELNTWKKASQFVCTRSIPQYSIIIIIIIMLIIL